jgi:anti-anti-sigma factor
MWTKNLTTIRIGAILRRVEFGTPMDRGGAVDEWQGFECFIEYLGGCTEVAICGDVDVSTAGQFAGVLDEAIGASRHLVLDMARVTFLDSSGLGVVLRAKLALAADGSITVRNAPGSVKRVFEITGLDEEVGWEFDKA